MPKSKIGYDLINIDLNLPFDTHRQDNGVEDGLYNPIGDLKMIFG